MRAARARACRARRSRPPPCGSRPPRCCPPPAPGAAGRSPAAARHPCPARLPVGHLGRAVIPEEAVDLPLPVPGLACRQRVLRLQATLGGPLRLLQGLRPGAVQLHDLGAMHQAASGEGDQVGLVLAPVGEGGGPLLGAADLVGVLASQDHAAVDDPRDDRGELAGGDRHHRLVQQRQALLGAPEPDQDVALLVCGEGEQVRVAEALADRHRLCRRSRRPPPGRRSPPARRRAGAAGSRARRSRSPSRSSSRWARRSQPPARPISPPDARVTPIQKAQRRACNPSPASRWAR